LGVRLAIAATSQLHL
jgi:hypothetical protein